MSPEFYSVWAKVPTHDYLVSIDGNCIRLERTNIQYSGKIKRNMMVTYPNRALKQSLENGYVRYSLSKDGKIKRVFSHFLVMSIFIGNQNKLCINHINGIHNDNRVENLEWCTYQENEEHSRDVLNKQPVNRKIDFKYIISIRESLLSNRELGEIYGVSKTTIASIKKGKFYATATSSN